LEYQVFIGVHPGASLFMQRILYFFPGAVFGFAKRFPGKSVQPTLASVEFCCGRYRRPLGRRSAPNGILRGGCLTPPFGAGIRIDLNLESASIGTRWPPLRSIGEMTAASKRCAPGWRQPKECWRRIETEMCWNSDMKKCSPA
jgi:hypothetical protein